jgi:hypothetical protein
MELENIIKKYVSEYIAKRIGGKFGLSEEDSKSIINEFITMFLGRMRDNASKTPEMTLPLFEAVRDDHDGSVLDNVDEVLTHSEQFKGDKIIGHIFGSNGENLKEILAKHTNIPSDQAGKIVETVAPFIMGAIGKEQHDANIDAKAFEQLLQR